MRDEIDRILDAALASYSNDSSNPGLEDRVLRRLDARTRTKRTWAWAAILAPATCAVLLLFMHPKPTVTPRREPIVTVPKPDIVRVSVVHSSKPKKIRKRRQAPYESMTDRNLRALRLMANLPPEQLTKLDFHGRDEVTIAPLEIKPLTIEPE